ncbi:phage protein [Streptococcus pneumoniae]|nr:phage protein [Streptococcus pneumoniae]CIX31624.1 phage protein [Streptococcus pneumoniae]
MWNEHSPFYEPVPYTSMVELFLKELKQLDESEIGHADEAPRYVKNILARLRELPLHDREVWLKAIMSEFEQDFSHAKWREGYEQGKIEGMVEREKVVVPQFVADWYEENKDSFEFNVWDWIAFRDEAKKSENREFNNWINNTRENPIQTLVNMHNFGYEVEKEKRYLVTLKNRQPLVKSQSGSTLYFSQDITARNYKGTQKELEEAKFGWVFDCPGIEIEEVEYDTNA